LHALIPRKRLLGHTQKQLALIHAAAHATDEPSKSAQSSMPIAVTPSPVTLAETSSVPTSVASSPVAAPVVAKGAQDDAVTKATATILATTDAGVLGCHSTGPWQMQTDRYMCFLYLLSPTFVPFYACWALHVCVFQIPMGPYTCVCSYLLSPIYVFFIPIAPYIYMFLYCLSPIHVFGNTH